MIRLLLTAVLAAGCALGPPAVDGRLVTVEAHGGHCPEGECRRVFAIESDGLVHQLEPHDVEVYRVSEKTIDAYRAALSITDFKVLRSRPFTGDCPTAFDGTELIYTFATPSGPERIASCEVQIDRQAPLFVAVDAILGVDVP